MHLSHIPVIAALAAASLATTEAITVQLTVTNNSPDGGVGLAPVWVGFHNGSFDSYDGGAAAAPALETLAEVGNPGPLSDVFASDGTLVATGTAQFGNRVQWNSGVLAPGASASVILELADDGSNAFLSYASMILPSNDFFIANGNPTAHEITSAFATGNFAVDVGLAGAVNDAGTEINDFLFSAGNAFGPAGLPAGDAAAGTAEGGLIGPVVGDPFSPFLNAPDDFSTGNLYFNDATLYPQGIATIGLQVIPEPSTGLLALVGAAGLAFRRRRVVS